jgi:hypothetical protein
MDVWDNDFLDLVEEAHLTFTGAASDALEGSVEGTIVEVSRQT